jgi:hypothetical protein
VAREEEQHPRRGYGRARPRGDGRGPCPRSPSRRRPGARGCAAATEERRGPSREPGGCEREVEDEAASRVCLRAVENLDCGNGGG